MIGHRTIDILAASRADMGSILVQTGEAGQDGVYLVEPHFTVPSIVQAIDTIRSFEAAQQV